MCWIMHVGTKWLYNQCPWLWIPPLYVQEYQNVLGPANSACTSHWHWTPSSLTANPSIFSLRSAMDVKKRTPLWLKEKGFTDREPCSYPYCSRHIPAGNGIGTGPILILFLERDWSWKVSTWKRNTGLLVKVTLRSGRRDLKKPQSFGLNHPKQWRSWLWLHSYKIPRGNLTVGNWIKKGLGYPQTRCTLPCSEGLTAAVSTFRWACC